MRNTVSLLEREYALVPKLLERMRSALPGRDPSAIGLGLSGQGNVKLLGQDGTVLAVILQRELPCTEMQVLKERILSQSDCDREVIGRRTAAFAALSRELGVKILYEKDQAVLYLQGERFSCRPAEDPFAEAGRRVREGSVLSEKEWEHCREKLLEELLAGIFAWMRQSGIPRGAEPAGALLEELSRLADPVLNGAVCTRKTRCRYFLKDRTYLVETQAGCCRVRDGVLLACRPSAHLRELRKLTAGKRYQACAGYFTDLAGQQKITVLRARGAGVLLGSTDLSVECLGHRFSHSWACTPFSASMSSWKKTCREQLLAIRKRAEEEEERCRARFAAAAAPFAGSFLVEDIAACILANAERITERALIQSLRGTKVSLESGVRESAGAGRYRLLSKEEISETVRALCNAGFVTRAFRSGYYADYYLLKPGQDLARFLEPSCEDPEEALQELARGETLTDRKAQAAFDAILTRERTDADWVYLLALAACRGFFCRNQDRYLKALSDLSREGRALVRMREDAEEDPFVRKVLRRILQSARKKSKEPGGPSPDAGRETEEISASDRAGYRTCRDPGCAGQVRPENADRPECVPVVS